MRLQFESGLSYQLDAIAAVADVFDGVGKGEAQRRVATSTMLGFDQVIANHCPLSPETLRENWHTVQSRHGLPQTDAGPHLSIEMETGTGKTYVYLRTIRELNARYGFSKFVIVVPSIAIKEGTIKNLEITREHFALLYDNQSCDMHIYDPKKRGQLKQFATADALQILLIGIDSFTKSENVIRQDTDWGVALEYLRATQPIVVVDEPQNMETDKRRQGIADLSPLITLRYSATHKNPYNTIYKLDPVQAYDLGLVKTIEVDSVHTEEQYAHAYVKVQKVTAKKKGVTATIEIDASDAAGVQKRVVEVKPGDDLFALSGEREAYRGYRVDGINAIEKVVTFANGKTAYLGRNDGAFKDAIMKYQIKKTIENHFDKELALRGRGIKVLSLFFIDAVANYRMYSEAGPEKGKFALWFEESFTALKSQPRYASIMHEAEQVHDGYFSADKKTGAWKDSRDSIGEGGGTKDDDDAYRLIMKDKERLLDLATPLRFIFTHSALREGWDNPNVFQICTLNETTSEMKKRQEIGRGLRLPVDATGARVREQGVSVLTVIPNESYAEFAASLQKEIEDACGVPFSGRIKKKEDRKRVRLTKQIDLDPAFMDLWERIKHKTTYAMRYTTEELITVAVANIRAGEIRPPRIMNTRVRVAMSEAGIATQILAAGAGEVIAIDSAEAVLADVLYALQSKGGLTRKSAVELLASSRLMEKIVVNGQAVIDAALKGLEEGRADMIERGITYTKLPGETFALSIFDEQELERYLDTLYEVQKKEKTTHDYIVVDSTVERDFATDLETRADVKFYCKLPSKFKIDTPLGSYTPDWVIVFDGDRRVYFVAETKGGVTRNDMSLPEWIKTRCGARHFSVLDGARIRWSKNWKTFECRFAQDIRAQARSSV